MQKFVIRKSKKSGLPPGSLVHIGKRHAGNIKINVIDYTESKCVEQTFENAEDCFKFKKTKTNTWINVDGIHDPVIIEKIGKYFEIHPLLLEDIMNSEQRPKMEDYGEYIFVVLKMLYIDGDGEEIEVEQVSIIIGKNYVISFQEKEGDVFDKVRERIRNGKGKIRKMGTDYLAYAIMDSIVDNYFIILENFGETIEELEEEVITVPTPETSKKIHLTKREMIALRKAVWPLREVIRNLETTENAIIRNTTKIYLRDVYDHTVQIIDNVETFRDVISGMLDIYLSSISNKLNEVMKVLTIFSTIFIPLTFIVGVYGMNFQFMPELHWKYSYPILWGIMILITASMLYFFRKKRWL